MLSSFACQLLGHRLHEDLVAPPRWFHGLVAAWPLEMTALWLRLGVPVADVVDGPQFWVHVDAIRAKAMVGVVPMEQGTQYREL